MGQGADDTLTCRSWCGCEGGAEGGCGFNKGFASEKELSGFRTEGEDWELLSSELAAGEVKGWELLSSEQAAGVGRDLEMFSSGQALKS